MRTIKYLHWLSSMLPLRSAKTCVALFAVTTGITFAQPAQEPLLTRSTPVQPNLLYILDTSGSMGGSVVESQAYRAGTGACGDDEIRTSSPYVNLLYYDPRKRYRPGRTNTGDAGTNAAIDGNADVEVYLPNGWNAAPAFSTAGSFNPLASNSRVDICTRANYVRYQVSNLGTFYIGGTTRDTATATATNPFGTKAPARVDCAGAVCTFDEERQNVANWRAFHRTRQLAARTGTGEAFANVPTTFRLSYGTIFATAPASFPVIQEYPLARTDFYTWINGLGVNGNTPLRSALDSAGRYFQQTTNNGPWASTPWSPTSEAAASHVSCRRNFSILVTDGEWNGGIPTTAAVRLDVDGTNGPAITPHPNGATYQYLPRSADRRSVGKSDRTAGTNFADTLADVGMYYWVNDLRPDLPNNVSPGSQSDPAFWQHMSVYTAAFGVSGLLNPAQIAEARLGTRNWLNTQPVNLSTNTIDDLVHTAHNTGGRFLELTDADSFTSELGKAISEIADQQFSQAGVAASAVSLSAGTKKFVPTYNPSAWWGNMRALNLDARGAETGLAWEVVKTVNGKPTGVTTIPAPSSRKIYAFVNRPSTTSVMIPFTRTNLNSNGMIASSVANNTITRMINTTDNDLVEYLRGVRTREGDGIDDFRKREAILGDIANSTPAFVKDYTDVSYANLPTTFTGAAAWNAYASSKASREGLLFVGANDGMVHIFREGTTTANQGAELLAFVPRSVLGKLHLLARKPYTHQYYVDGPMSQHDAYITAPRNNASGTRTGWFNLVAGTSGAGARNVFMMNASDGASMTERNYMWEINHTMTGFGNLGNVMNAVQMGVMQNGTWVAVFNNGPYGNDGRAYLFVVNLSTGALIRAIPTDALNSNGLGGVRLVRDTTGVIVGAYAGDLRGRMWRFDLKSTNSASWSASRLYTAFEPSSTTVRQPITAASSVFKRNDGKPGYIVTFGTGKLFDSTDQTSTSVQSVYGIWDNTEFDGTAAANGIDGRSLLVQTSVIEVTNTSTVSTGTSTQGTFNKLYDTTQTRNIDWDTDRGWYMDLNLALGQRLIYPVESLSGAVRIDTIAPRLNPQACDASSSVGFNFILSPLAGKCFNQPIFDTNNDGRVNSTDTKACGYDTDSDGQDVILSRPDQQCTTTSSYTTTTTPCSSDDLCCLVKTGKFTSACSTILSTEDFKTINLSCSEDPSSSSTFRRDWRQLFLRP